MGKPGDKYQPSNGTEGIGFTEHWCGNCERDRAYREDRGDGCEIVAACYALRVTDSEYPSEWTYDDKGIPRCTAFVPEGEKVPEKDDKTVDMFDDPDADRELGGQM